MIREKILMASGENPALEELHLAIRHHHGQHIGVKDLHNILASLYYRQELCKIFRDHTMVVHRGLAIDWVGEKAAYHITDRLRILAPVHLKIIMYLRQQADGVQVIVSEEHIEYILRKLIAFSSKNALKKCEPAHAEIEYVCRKMEPLVGNTLELNADNIATVSFLIEEAHVSYVIENF